MRSVESKLKVSMMFGITTCWYFLIGLKIVLHKSRGLSIIFVSEDIFKTSADNEKLTHNQFNPDQFMLWYYAAWDTVNMLSVYSSTNAWCLCCVIRIVTDAY